MGKAASNRGVVSRSLHHGESIRKFATGCCNYPSTACIHHVLHVAFHFKSEVPFVLCSTKAMKQLLFTIGQIRGDYRTGGYVTMEGTENLELTNWIEATPVFKKWVMSPVAFVAPAAWPGDVEKMFRLRGEVPSPYEVAGLRSSSHVKRGLWHCHEVSVLLAYSFGMPVSLMAEGMEVDPTHILADMIQGVEKLCSIPQFRLWCWNLDLNLVPLPPLEGYSLNDRLEVFEALRSHPFNVKTAACRALLDAPFFKSYAKLKLLPPQLKRRPHMGTPLVGPPKVRKTNGKKKDSGS
jgi:hypothetical protein